MTFCTALIPSRRRVHGLERALDSFIGTASHPEKVAAVIRFDQDDAESITLFHYQKYPWAKVVIGPRGDGYDNLNAFYNDCMSLANSEWFVLLDDDVYWEGKGWDDELGKPPQHTIAQLPIYYAKNGNRERHKSGPGGCPCGVFFPNNYSHAYLGGFFPEGKKADEYVFKYFIEHGDYGHRELAGTNLIHERVSDEVWLARQK